MKRLSQSVSRCRSAVSLKTAVLGNTSSCRCPIRHFISCKHRTVCCNPARSLSQGGGYWSRSATHPFSISSLIHNNESRSRLVAALFRISCHVVTSAAFHGKTEHSEAKSTKLSVHRPEFPDEHPPNASFLTSRGLSVAERINTRQRVYLWIVPLPTALYVNTSFFNFLPSISCLCLIVFKCRLTHFSVQCFCDLNLLCTLCVSVSCTWWC